jgi:hypothetical protein
MKDDDREVGWAPKKIRQLQRDLKNTAERLEAEIRQREIKGEHAFKRICQLETDLAGTDKAVVILNNRISRVELALDDYGIPRGDALIEARLADKIPQFGAPWVTDEFSAPIGEGRPPQAEGLAPAPSFDRVHTEAEIQKAKDRDQYERGLTAGAAKAVENSERRLKAHLERQGFDSDTVTELCLSIRTDREDTRPVRDAPNSEGSMTFDARALSPEAWATVTGGVVRWTPTVREGESIEDVPLNQWIGEAIGAASMCWVGGTGHLEFDSTRATAISEALNEHVQAVISGVIEGTTKAVALPSPSAWATRRTTLQLAETRVRKALIALGFGDNSPTTLRVVNALRDAKAVRDNPQG